MMNGKGWMACFILLMGLTSLGADIGIYTPDLDGGRSFGGRAIENTLKSDDLSISEFSSLSIENLLKFKMVIIPNTKKMSVNENPKWRESLRAYVIACGGSLMFCHDAVGAKRSPYGVIPIFPEIVNEKSIEQFSASEVRVAIDPLLADYQFLPEYGINQIVPHMYNDHFAFMASTGKVLLKDVKTGKSVVVVADLGKGVVVLNGMYGGIPVGETARLNGVDKSILINVTKYCLASKKLIIDDPSKVDLVKWRLKSKKSASISKQVALIYGVDYEGSLKLAKNTLANSGIDYDYIPFSFLPIRGLSSKKHKLVIAYLQSGKTMESSDAFSELEKYIANGGKAIIYLPKNCSRRSNGYKLIAKYGIKGKKFHRANELLLRYMGFDNQDGFPKKVFNSVLGITDLSNPTNKNAQIIAYWYNQKGEKKCPAVIKTNYGFLINNSTYGDTFNNNAFIANMATQLVPELGKRIAANLIVNFERQKKKIIEETPPIAKSNMLINAKKLIKDANNSIVNGKFKLANLSILKAQAILTDAYGASMPVAPNEERMVFTNCKEDPDVTCARLSKAGFTGVALYHVMGHYPSALAESRSDGDVIDEWIQAGKKHKIKIGVSFSSFTIFKGSKTFSQGVKEDWRVVTARNYGKKAPPISGKKWRMSFCRAHPEITDYSIKKSLELIKKYPVDYVFYDGIRWSDTCYCDHCRESFIKETGLKIEKWPDDVINKYQKQYNDWRGKHITKVVREASSNIKKINPNIKMGVFTFRGKNSSWAKGQYWWEWSDYVDFVMPMSYTDNNKLLENLFIEINGLLPKKGRAALLPCLSPNGYSSASVLTMLRQISLQRKYAPAGIMYFRYLYLNDANLKVLGNGPFRRK